MKSVKLAREATRSLTRYGLRSIFMMLGLAVGISSLVVLSSIGESTRRDTIKRFKSMLGTFDTVIVRPGGGRSRGMPTLVNVPPTLRFEDAQAIATDIQEVKRVAIVQNAFDIDVKYRQRSAAPAIFGVSANWLELRSDEVASGVFFTDAEDAALARIAVIGADVQSQLFPDEEPLGKVIRIADVPFQIAGTLKSRGAGPAGASLDNLILIPVQTASRRLFNRDYLTMVIAQVKNPQDGDQTTAKVAALLRERHHIVPPALDDFTITNPAATMAQVSRAGSTLTKILVGVAAMALLIGAIVICGLMSIAVAQRQKEIGIRRSVGAARADIVIQFLLEAILVACAGGLLGAGVGLAGARIVAQVQKLPAVVLWQFFATAIALSVSVGIVSGIYPAWKASRVDPIRELRS